MTRAELEAAIASIGRPQPFIGRDRTDTEPRSIVDTLHGIQRNLRDLRDWDAANPSKRIEWERLTQEFDALERREREVATSHRMASRAMEVLEHSGAGERSLQAATNPEAWPSLVATQKWFTEQPTPWMLVLRGNPGLGKTVAACWALRRAALQGEGVASRSVRAVASLSGFDAGSAELKMLQRTGLLVLNDLGREHLNEWGQATLFDLIDARYEANARTICTSNKSWDEMKTRLGEALVDRIRHGGRVIDLTGTSLRRQP